MSVGLPARPMPRRLLSAVLLTALLVGGAPLLTHAPAAAEPAAPAYVALGDSYSSGTGTRDYIADGTDCQRSTSAYPSLIASARGYALDFRACSGARVADVTRAQLSALSAATSYVTVSVGGNDAGFADVLTECATPWWAGDCDGAIDGAQAFVAGTLPGRLSTLYGQIRDAAPNAQVVVVGYPRIFMGEDCNALTWFSPEEQARLNQTADQLNARTAAVAASYGFGFADPTGRFVGHAVCDDPEWINGLSNPIGESYHPNQPGHASGYTPTVSPVLTGSAVTATPRLLATAAAQADELAAQQRTYAARDRAIEPTTVRVPDVTSAKARALAREHGVDLDRWLARQAG
ncbi:SGNH/GDSL hydrolase family protein [Nocardioides sp. GXQ0305]|uniref:SGNH/GDSL hydrolase family protein n=1 Tax=Nocardioides sp. GXQ0305 TaxID=3423912 RepID=UPI003D7C4B82